MKYVMFPTCRITLLAVLALVVLAVPGSVAAATWYVGPAGSDTNPGTQQLPLATPERALALAAPWDTVLLLDGTYTLTRSLIVMQRGLTVASAPGNTRRAAIVGSTRDTRNLTAIFYVYASDVTIENLEIQGASYYGIKLDDAYGPQTNQKIIGCYIHHTGRDGIKTQSADNVLILNNEIAFTGVRDSSNAEGIDIMASYGATVRGNYIHDTATNGLFVKAGTKDAIVESNVVVNPGTAGILLGSESALEFMRDGAQYEAMSSIARNNIVVNAAMAALMTVAGHDVQFLNNTVVNAARTAQAAFRAVPNQRGVAADGITLKNNVLTTDPSSTRPLVHLYNVGTFVSDFNVWFSPSGTYEFWRESSSGNVYWKSFDAWKAGMHADLSSMVADPELDPNALYKPIVGSVVLDNGTALSQVPTDYSGVLRPQGLAYDIGAHEGAVTGSSPLARPTNLVLTANGTSITLAWSDNSVTEDGFRIERSTDNKSFTAVAAVGPDGTSYIDTGLRLNRTYYYRVVAFDGAVVSDYSNTASLTLRR